MAKPDGVVQSKLRYFFVILMLKGAFDEIQHILFHSSGWAGYYGQRERRRFFNPKR
jgi:hypothetical protein